MGRDLDCVREVASLTTASAAASPAEVPLSERPEVRKHRDMSREALLID